MLLIRLLIRPVFCVFACVRLNQSLVQVPVHSTQRVIMGLSVTCHLWWASTINIYGALNQPHTEHCDSNHPSFLISPSRSILISISRAWWSHAVCWTSYCSQRWREKEGGRRAKHSWHQAKPEMKHLPWNNQSGEKLMSCSYEKKWRWQRWDLKYE